MNIGELKAKLDEFDDEDNVVISVTSEDGDAVVEVESGTIASVTGVEYNGVTSSLVITAEVADEDNDATSSL